MNKERVRFAPSPTGALHIGGLRTALFNYLYTKNKKGTFILRLEDTDRKRFVKGSENYIDNALDWLGISPNEGPVVGGKFGPYRQSERIEIYQEKIEELLKSKKAYYAFDTNESLAKLRSYKESEGKVFKYDYTTRRGLDNSLSMEEEELKVRIEKEPFVVRLRVDPGETNTKDLLRGDVKVNNSVLDDKVLIKADGFPTYHFANVVDDYLMEITTVIRGEEWLPSLAIHNLIYEAFEWKKPLFIHLPLILKTKGKGKLSKRDGLVGNFPVYPLVWDEVPGFKELGFLNSGLANYLAMLGWNSGLEKEIYDLSELIKLFSLNGLQKGGAKFDFEKAKWVNQQHISKLNFSEFDAVFYNYTSNLKDKYGSRSKEVYNLIRERLKTGNELEKEISFFIHPPIEYNNKILNKLSKNNISELLDEMEILIKKRGLFNFKENLSRLAEKKKMNFGEVMQTIRLSIVGNLSGPDIIKTCHILGKSLTLDRVVNLKKFLKNNSL